MSERNRSKVAGPLRAKVGDDGEQVEAAADEELPLYIRPEPGQVEAAKKAIEDQDIEILSDRAGYLAADVPASKIADLVEAESIRQMQERRTPEAHTIAEKNVSEGVEIINADALQNEDVTGTGARIAVIDHTFHTENPKYEDNIVATVGPSSAFTDDEEYAGNMQHGTACAEIVADIAPDAELILASTLGTLPFSYLMDEIETYDPDAATMSLGYYTGLRIDGQDPISDRVDEFTDGGRLFAVSAGNDGAWGHWDGEFENDGDDLMVFDQSLQTPTRFPVYMDPITSSAEIHIHWDEDWEQDDQVYEARLYREPTSTTALDTSQTTDPVEILELTPSQNTNNGEWFYVEIEKINATGNEHFDMFHWGRAQFNPDFSTAERSIGIPATSPDEDTLAVAAVQAVDDTTENSEMDRDDGGYLKTYSSRGPTQDGRRGIDIAAPSMVSTTDEGDYGGYGALEDDGGFNGTSAASPHVGGAFGLLFGDDVGATRSEIRDAVSSTGTSIDDPEVSEPSENNTEIGDGYLDAKAAYDTLTVEETTLDVSGDTIPFDGTAYIEIDAELVDKVDVEYLWIDWDVDAAADDGADTENNVETDGTYTFSWNSTKDIADLVLSIGPNGDDENGGILSSDSEKYVGGKFLLTVTAAGPEKTIEETTTLELLYV